MKIRIGKRSIGDNEKTFIIAEAGINHNGQFKIAKKMIEKAKDVGADAIKFQTFRAKDLASEKSHFYNIFKKLELEDNEYAELSDFAKSQKIIFFSTPSSEKSTDLLSSIKIPLFKISSGDLTNIPLIKYIASKKKPIIISTGMSDLSEIKEGVNAIKSQNNNKILIMHSVSSYPTPPEDANLKSIEFLKRKFQYPIGYSDNGSEILVPVTAVSLGAKMIEKHFTLRKKMKGPDHSFSADPNELKLMINQIRVVEEILGNGKKRCMPSELENKINARKGLTANVTIEKGSKITKEMITIKRPATGIQPKFFNSIIGKRAKTRIKIDSSINRKDISK